MHETDTGNENDPFFSLLILSNIGQKLKQFSMSVRRCLGTVSWKMPWSVPVETQSALISPESLASAIKSESDVVVLDSTVLIASEATGYDEYSKQVRQQFNFYGLKIISCVLFVLPNVSPANSRSTIFGSGLNRGH